MSIKKALLLASMALAAIAFAAPASAFGQGEIVDVTNEKTITSGTEIDLAGEAEFTSLGTGIFCDVEATVTADTATTGTTDFTINTPSCEGFGFLYQGCDVVGDVTSEYHVDVETTDFTVTNAEIFSDLENCESGLTFTDLTFESVTITPDTYGPHGGITTVELSGEGEAHADPGTLGVEAHGTLHLAPGDADTWDIVEE